MNQEQNKNTKLTSEEKKNYASAVYLHNTHFTKNFANQMIIKT